MALLLLFFTVLQLPPVMEAVDLPDIEIEKYENHSEKSEKKENEVSLILEVEGNPEKNANYIETYHPDVEVVSIYKLLFQGIAVKGAADKVHALQEREFVKEAYPVQRYHTFIDPPVKDQLQSGKSLEKMKKYANVHFPSEVNQTPYTGKGSKVGVIDTGIDVNHPDLQNNYLGGFDLVDLDEEPLETTIDEGMPTLHGSHVSGIIAADGELKGVAPDSELYVYRALGPGGAGTSIQVIAALEEAVKDEMDIVNLSLGNTVNGPDYPTSKAVNEAVKQGVAVVAANGNDGPEDWTVGAPATASGAVSVGAFENKERKPVLYEPSQQKSMEIQPLSNAPSWLMERDYLITADMSKANGNFYIIEQSNQNIGGEIQKAQKNNAKGIIIHETHPEDLKWRELLQGVTFTVPAAVISEADGNWIKKRTKSSEVYFKTKYKETKKQVAPFSSRGPVAANWMVKPDLIAPGVNIVSTVPGGYERLNGTSMAAPHVAGALAVMKEAHPNWSNEQLIGALKTTADKIDDMSPIEQGAGLINLNKAIIPDVIIHNPLLSFGKIQEHINERTVSLKIENTTSKKQKYRFHSPKKEKGQTWNLPQSFEVEPEDTITVPITLKMDNMRIEKKSHKGYLSLSNENQTYKLPYTVVGDDEEFPRVMGFELSKKSTKKGQYKYSLYTSEEMEKVKVKLYDPDTLQDKGTLLEEENLQMGVNEGEIDEEEITQRGYYYALLISVNKQGEMNTSETEVFIE